MPSTKTKTKTNGGRQGADFQTIGLRLPPAQLDAVDLWIGRQADPKPTRREAVLRLMQIGLEAEGAPLDRLTDQERIDRIESRLASSPAPSGPPSPDKGMRMLRRGIAETKLQALKKRKTRDAKHK